MITSIAAAIAQNVILGWLWRRAQELAAWAFALIPVYLAMPPDMQETVRAIFTGQGGSLSVSAVFGLVWYLWTQWQSFRATAAPQVVTTDGKKAVLPKGSTAARQADAVAAAAPKPRTIWERLTQR
ncbi:hypothetical protein [Devosia sp. SD17-2]|uniref:hypothetical protein n=1 Tax=Devosia sp. SD17-2 TaxID=2976459 RepID=UPI0023D83644|nr:hypothetical protein [Devosia sp. SD17-2]WEJ33843.1 hypothetical protein NYQ88_03245 [Devosia sp. SD17-2]